MKGLLGSCLPVTGPQRTHSWALHLTAHLLHAAELHCDVGGNWCFILEAMEVMALQK